MYLLRKIRRILLEQSKIRNYLLYAVGEIFLVVIGILIAVEINTYDLDQKAAKRSIEYLKLMEDELSTDIRQWERIKKFNLATMDNLDTVIEALNSDAAEGVTNETVDLLLQSMTGGPIPKSHTTYTDLISSGNMGSIQPKELRQHIISYYNVIETLIEHSKQEYEFVWNHFHPFFSTQGYYDMKRFDDMEISGIDPGSHFRSFLKEPNGSREFMSLQNNILLRKAILWSQNAVLDEMVSETRELLEATGTSSG